MSMAVISSSRSIVRTMIADICILHILVRKRGVSQHKSQESRADAFGLTIDYRLFTNNELGGLRLREMT